MKHRFLYKNFFLILSIDVLILICSLYSGYLVRFDFSIPSHYLSPFIQFLPLILLIKIMVFYYFDLYRGMWRYTSVSDFLNIIKASSVASLIIICFILYKTRFADFSRSVFLIDWCLTIFFISASRLCIRFYFETISQEKSLKGIIKIILNIIFRKKNGYKRLLILGAGDCGEKIYREIKNNITLKYNVIGFLDDNIKKIDLKIH